MGRATRNILMVLSAFFWGITSHLYAGTPGELDTNFGNGGWATTDIENGSFDTIGAAVVQNDGKLVVAGSRNISGGRQLAVVRYMPDGTLDDTFGSSGKVITNVWLDEFVGDMALQPDGKLLIAGGGDGLIDKAFLVRLNTDGSFDTEFDEDGIVTLDFGFNDAISTFLEITESTILVAGTGGLARFTINGTLDATFGDGDGVLTLEEVLLDGRAVTGGLKQLQSNGKIVVAGSYAPNLQPAQIAVRRHNTDGSLDLTFGTQGFVTFDIGSGEDSVGGLLVDGNDNIILAGRVNNGAPNYDSILLIRCTNDGDLDTSFGENGIVISDAGFPNEILSDLAIYDTNYFVSGYFSNGVLTALYDVNGTLNSDFSGDGIADLDTGLIDDAYPTRIALATDATAFIVGHADGDFLVGKIFLTSLPDCDEDGEPDSTDPDVCRM